MIVDVSKWEGAIGWDKLAPSLDFIIIRSSIGDKTDPYFEANAAACRAHNVPMHVFHYMNAANPIEAEKEAKYFWQAASSHRPISYVVDVEGEALTGGAVIETTRAFIARLRALGAGKIGLYTGNWAYDNYGFGAVERDWTWIARYGADDGKIPGPEYRPSHPCDLWQYTDQGSAPGIKGNCDLNILFGDKPMAYFTERGDGGMEVLIGSAHGDERGNAHGGQAGDQTGGEVSTERWYKHPKGWRVFRAKDPEARERIAQCMQAACDNPHVGYDQYQRDTLYNAAEPLGFDCSKVETACETDCSALERVCAAFAGIPLPDFNTETEPGVLLRSGAFDELTGAEYTNSSDRLLRGDILVTRTKGHTATVMNDGARADGTIRRGDKGEEVRVIQRALLALGYDLGSYGENRDGVDGDFGGKTEAAVKAFQGRNGLPVTGACDAATVAALLAPELYTVTLRGVTKAELESILEGWPDAEVSKA